MRRTTVLKGDERMHFYAGLHWRRVALCLAILLGAFPAAQATASGTEPERAVLVAQAGSAEVAGLLAQAAKASGQGNPEAALPLVQKAVTLAPGAPEPYYQLGLVYRALARDNEAEQAFSKAAQLSPSEPRYHYALGLAYRQTGKENLALAEFLQVLRLKPDDPAAHYQAGELLADQGDPEEAAKHWEAALQASPDFTPALKSLGRYHYGQDNRDEAIALWEKAAQQDAYDADLWWLLANGLAERNQGDDWADAVWAFQRFRNVASPSTDPTRLQQADQVLAGNADRAARRLVARGIEAEKDPKQAAVYFNRALDLRPDFAEAYYNLGLSLQRSGRYAEAASAYEQAAALAPGQAAVHANLGTA
ncbi:MAG TPA: tetratricopeptide repeat protein, partial [Firmicutes bacterium]|nr:tetratricopeptide repeat protein [Bacillota bacterium]